MTRVGRVLALVGPVAVVMGLAQYHASHIAEPSYSVTGTFRFPWTVAFIAMLLAASYAAGLPDGRSSVRGIWLAAIVAPIGAAVGVSLAQLLVGAALLPRFVVLGSAAMLVPWNVLCARLTADVDARARDTAKALVVGEQADVGVILVELDTVPERPASVVGILTVAEARAGRGRTPLIEAAESTGATIVVLDSAAQADPSIVRQAAALHESGLRVRALTTFYEQWLGKLPIGELERVSLMFDIAEIHGGAYSRVKRLLDVVAGVACGVACVAILPLVAAANLVGNRGPLLFRQERVGKGGTTFTMLKFRTMVPTDGDIDAEADEALDIVADGSWTQESDARVTTFGRLLRRSHLDELPQAWNMVAGDLSLVGPRPEQPRYVDELTDKLPFYPMRHLVRPGLTGWAQVKYGYAADHADALEKLQYEFFYLRHQSLLLDLRIVVRTLRSVVGGRGAGR